MSDSNRSAVPPLPKSAPGDVPPLPFSAGRPPPQASTLQFDRADYAEAGSGSACGSCSQSIATEYYELNGQVICTPCRDRAQAATSKGTSLTRFARALFAGILAAIAGAALYYLVTAVTGYEIGLIAIVVGFAVGAAVKWGSYGRGGWRYQTLAMVLTYVAIVSTYVPTLIGAIRQDAAQTSSAASPDAPAPVADAQPTALAAPDGTRGASSGDVSVGGMLVAVAMLAGFLMAVPFLAGFENIMGIIIIGIGLYEAWKINKRPTMSITGPHSVARRVIAPTASA